MFESKSGVLLIAGIGFFALAFFSNGAVPLLMYPRDKYPERTAEQEVNGNVLHQFQDLAEYYPEQVQKHVFPGVEAPRVARHFADLADQDKAALLGGLLREGKKVYVGEGCWHCHSQFVRPVSNEDRRWGAVAVSQEYNNELQRPVMFGTRRVGPDLSREGGRRSNDWHAVHFYKPKMTSPQTVMPEYPWLFDADETGRASPGLPNRRGLALILYMQWLGSWREDYPHYNLGRAQDARGGR